MLDIFLDHLAQNGDVLPDLIFARGREIQTHGVFPAAVGTEEYAGHIGDILLEYIIEHLQCIVALGKLHPEEETAAGGDDGFSPGSLFIRKA